MNNEEIKYEDVYDIDSTSTYDVPIISMDIFKTKNDRKEKDNGNQV